MGNVALQSFNNGQPVDWKSVDDFRETIPAGEYRFAVSNTEERVSKNSGDSMLSIQFTVRQGEFKGQSIFQLFLLGHSNERIRNKHWKTLSTLGKAVGVPRLQSTGEIMHKEFMGTVSEKEDDFGWRNEIKKFEPLEGLAALQQQQVEQQTTQQQSGPQVTTTTQDIALQQPVNAQQVTASDLEFE